MAESEAIQSVVTQLPILAATAAVMVMRKADAEPVSDTTWPVWEKHKDKGIVDQL